MPAYNTELLMEKVIRDIPSETMEDLDTLLIIDDGSSDGTAQVARMLRDEFPKISLLQHSRNRGYGAAQKTAFDWILEHQGDIAVMLHSDGQYPPQYLVPMHVPFDKNAAVVCGSRVLYGDMRKGGMSRVRYYGTMWLNSLENLIFRQKLTSYHSGYKAYSRRALDTISYNSYSDAFNFDSEMLAGAIRTGTNIEEVPIPTIHGAGFSSLKPVPYGISVLHTLVRYIFGRI